MRPEEEIVLIIDEAHVEEAVRDLVRIGFDHVRGYVTPAALSNSALADRIRSIPVIDFDAADEARGRSGVTMLDVRRASEYEAGHVPDSLNISHTRLLARLDEVPETGELLVYCRSGARASSAVAMLDRAGRKVSLVDDEFARWSGQAA